MIAARIDQLLRKAFPSISRLSFHPVVRTVVDSCDLPGRVLIREFRSLPPNHMRIRVGVGNRLVGNELLFFKSYEFWLFAFASGWCNLRSHIVDIGCGCGRYAHHLRDIEFRGRRFTGRYVGIDIDREMLDWCRSHFDSERFQFFESSDDSTSYCKQVGSDQPYHIPLGDGSADFVFSTSLFTHLLEPELRNYVMESLRLLKPGGYAVHSCFCIDHPPPTFGGRHTFRHRIGAAHVESISQPEAAVAYSEDFLRSTAMAAGFREVYVLAGGTSWQPLLVCRKAD